MRELVLDYETTSVDKDPGWWNPKNRILLEGWYYPDTDEVFQYNYMFEIRENLIVPPDPILIIGHNLSFDIGWHMRSGSWTKHNFLRWFRSPNVQIWDTQLVEYILQGQNVTRQSMRLKDLCVRYGIAEKDWSVDWQLDLSEQELKEYNELDLRYTYALYQHQLQAIPASMLSFIASQMRMQKVTIAASIRGVEFDRVAAQKSKEELHIDWAKLHVDLEEEMRKYGGSAAISWNPASTVDVGIILFGGRKSYTVDVAQMNSDGTAVTYKSGVKKGQIKYKKTEFEADVQGLFHGSGTKTDKGNYVVDDETLKHLTHDFVDKLREYRNIKKELTTYYEAMLKFSESFDGCIHPQYNHTVTVTGRLSSSNPNLQNIKGE